MQLSLVSLLDDAKIVADSFEVRKYRGRLRLKVLVINLLALCSRSWALLCFL